MRNHSHKPGKCPICLVKEGKDYTSKHLYGHLQLRHRPESYQSKHHNRFPQAQPNPLAKSQNVPGQKSSQPSDKVVSKSNAGTTTQSSSTLISKSVKKPETNEREKKNQTVSNALAQSQSNQIQALSYNPGQIHYQISRKTPKPAERGVHLHQKQATTDSSHISHKPARMKGTIYSSLRSSNTFQHHQNQIYSQTISLASSMVPQQTQLKEQLNEYQKKAQLSQGLYGVFTFGVNPQSQEPKLQLTSKYLAEEDHIKALKKNAAKRGEEIKIAKLESLGKLEDTEKTDDGIQTDRDRQQPLMAEQTPLLGDNETNIEPREDDLGSSEESPLIKKLKKISEMNKETDKEANQNIDQQELQVPVYLQEVQKICFPEGIPTGQSVYLRYPVLQSNEPNIIEQIPQMSNPQLGATTPQNMSPQNIFSPAQKQSQKSVAQSPHRFGIFSQSHKSFSPNLFSRRGSQNNKEKVQNLPKFDPSAASKSPRLELETANEKLDHPTAPNGILENLCSFNDLVKMSKIVFYSTKTGTGEQYYLSILVCTQPHLFDGQSEFDEFIHAVLHPFAIVIVTTKPMFDSALGGQMLRLIYQMSFLPLYRFLTLESNNRVQIRTQEQKQEFEQIFRLEVAISLLFDSFNLMQASESEQQKTLMTEILEAGQKKKLALSTLLSPKNKADYLNNSIVTMNELAQQTNIMFAQRTFFEPNFSFKTLLNLISTTNIAKLFSCMLLEKKLILIADDACFQTQLALIIESLFKLLEPLDTQALFGITYALSEEMVFYMEKPGSLILGMSKSLWTKIGYQVWVQSFDTYIIAFDISKGVFHQKTPEPLGLPRTFSRLLRRSLHTVERSSHDVLHSVKVKQAFFNVLLLLIVLIRSQLEGSEQDSFLKARKDDQVSMTESFDSAQKSQVQAEYSPSRTNSPSRKKSQSNQSSYAQISEYQSKMEYPKYKEFLQEMRGTTAVIDLLDRLENKNESVGYFEQCLKIIEQQKHDWLENLLEVQANDIRAGLRHFAKDNSIHREISTTNLRDVINAYEESMKNIKDKSIVNRFCFNGACFETDLLSISLGDLFRVERKLVSKQMRMLLLQNAIMSRVQSQEDYQFQISNQSSQQTGGPSSVTSPQLPNPSGIKMKFNQIVGIGKPKAIPTLQLSTKPNEINIRTPAAKTIMQHNMLSAEYGKNSDHFSEHATPGLISNPLMSSPNKGSQKESQEKISNEATPNGINNTDNTKEALLVQRTRKPQAEFKQITSSEEVRENVQEEKHVPHVNFKGDFTASTDAANPLDPSHSNKQKSSILAMFTNFFSRQADEQVESEDQSSKLAPGDKYSQPQAARKASKSMQVMWPMQLKNQITSKLQVSQLANIKSLTVNHLQFEFLNQDKSIDQQKSELKSSALQKYNLKSLESGNFIFESGAVLSPSHNDKRVVGSSQDFSHTKGRLIQKRKIDDIFGTKSPQTSSFQSRGNSNTQQVPIQVSQKRKTGRKESGTKLEQLVASSKNPVAPKINSYGYFSSRSNKVVKSADFGSAFGLMQIKAAHAKAISPQSSIDDTDERGQALRASPDQQIVNLNRQTGNGEEEAYETQKSRQSRQIVEILQIDQDTLIKKNDQASGQRNRDRLNRSGEKDQANEFGQSTGDVSHFKTSIAGSSIAQEASMQMDSEGINKEEGLSNKKALQRHSTGHFNVAQGFTIKKASQGQNVSRQQAIISRQSYPFSTSSLSSGGGVQTVSKGMHGGKSSHLSNYQSTGTPSKVKIFSQNSSSSNQQNMNKSGKVMLKEKGGQGKISVVKKTKINLLDGGDSCNVSSTHSIRDSHLATPLSQPIDKKASYQSQTSTLQQSPGQKLAMKKKQSKEEDSVLNRSSTGGDQQPKGDLEGNCTQKLKISISKLQSKQQQKMKSTEVSGKISKTNSGRNLKYNSPRPMVKGISYQASTGNGENTQKNGKGETKSVNQSMTSISKQKFASSTTQIIKLTTMQGKTQKKDDNFFEPNHSSSNTEILSPKRTQSPTQRAVPKQNRPKANSQYSNSGTKAQELNQIMNTSGSKSNRLSKMQASVSISMAQTLPSNSITHSQSMQIAPQSTNNRPSMSKFSSQQANEVIQSLLKKGMQKSQNQLQLIEGQQQQNARNCQKGGANSNLSAPSSQEQLIPLKKQVQLESKKSLTKQLGSNTKQFSTQKSNNFSGAGKVATHKRRLNNNARTGTSSQEEFLNPASNNTSLFQIKRDSARQSVDNHQPDEREIGDPVDIETENLQEVLDGYEGNRVRSISHQFPSQISFLKGSQERMQLSKLLQSKDQPRRTIGNMQTNAVNQTQTPRLKQRSFLKASTANQILAPNQTLKKDKSSSNILQKKQQKPKDTNFTLETQVVSKDNLKAMQSNSKSKPISNKGSFTGKSQLQNATGRTQHQKEASDPFLKQYKKTMQMLNNYAESELTLIAPSVETAGGINHNSHTPLMKPPTANQGDDDDLSFLTSPVASRMQQVVQQHNEPQHLMLDLTKFDE